jgi:hypothetical protein
MNLNETTQQIEQIVDWYHNLTPDFTGINDLMYKRIQLSTLLFYYSVELGEVRKQWKMAEAETEISKRQAIKRMIDEGCPITKATEHGKIMSLDDYSTEKQLDGLYNSMKFIHDAAAEILNTINQHISNLKRELEPGSKY